MSNPSCLGCGQETAPASVPGGGRVAWFCETCDRLWPDGIWIRMEQETIGRPHP